MSRNSNKRHSDRQRNRYQPSWWERLTQRLKAKAAATPQPQYQAVFRNISIGAHTRQDARKKKTRRKMAQRSRRINRRKSVKR